MMQTLDLKTIPTLKEHAADALRRARRLPQGPARNDLRQLAIGLRSLDARGRRTADAVLIDVPFDEVPLAPL